MSTRSRAGFTLLEVILSMGILSLIALTLYGAFFTGHRAVVAGERAAEINQRMRVAEDIFARQIHSAVFQWARHDDDQFPYFVGRPDGVSFVSSAPQSRGGTGLAVVTYRVDQNRLILEERSMFTPDDLYDPPANAYVERAVLMEGFESLKLEYLARDDPDSNWQQNWDAQEEDAMPAVVRLTVGGLAFFDGLSWTTVVPLMTVAYGWGEEPEPPDEDEHYDQDDDKQGETDGEIDDADADMGEDDDADE
jgi:prepilin-type N-terminal cleavage/methylation domain-containing protein